MAKVKKKKNKPDACDAGLSSDLKIFLEGRLAEQAADGFSDSVLVEICVDGKSHYFTRKNSKNCYEMHISEPADVTFWLSESSLRHILRAASHSSTGLGELGIMIFESILSKDEASKIKFKVRASILSLWAKGYFSVLKAGGPEVASYLGKMGLGGISQLKEMLKKIRG